MFHFGLMLITYLLTADNCTTNSSLRTLSSWN